MPTYRFKKREHAVHHHFCLIQNSLLKGSSKSLVLSVSLTVAGLENFNDVHCVPDISNRCLFFLTGIFIPPLVAASKNTEGDRSYVADVLRTSTDVVCTNIHRAVSVICLLCFYPVSISKNMLTLFLANIESVI